VAPPARQPAPASPGRKARGRTSPGDTIVLQMAASVHRTITAPKSGRGKIRRHRHGKDARHGHGQGNGQENGNGQGQGNGNGNGQGNGNGNAPALSVLSQLPGLGGAAIMLGLSIVIGYAIGLLRA
jgi:hypothetical protein